MTDARTEARWDRERDYRKHDFELLPINARNVALLARASTTSFDEAVRLIQQFADTVASHAVVKATEHTSTAILAAFDGVVPK